MVMIAMGAYFISQPKQETVEWHKREHLRAWKRFHERDWRGRLADWAGDSAPDFVYVSKKESDSLRAELGVHREALLRLGYLSERVVVFSNRVPSRSEMTQWLRPFGEDERFVDCVVWLKSPKTTVLLSAPRENIDSLQDWLRKLDVPESSDE
jgi:hypothetical protein